MSPREAARDVIDLLRGQGLRRVVMLTGDNAAAASHVARELGIDGAPCGAAARGQGGRRCTTLQTRYGTVAMVGDGVNDAPALAAADVGIAMGAAGSDAALETADVALMADDLSKIPFALRLSRATLRNIKTNIAVVAAAEVRVPGAGAGRPRHALDGDRGRHRGVAARHRERAPAAQDDLTGIRRPAGTFRPSRTG